MSTDKSPWHAGERALHERLGISARMEAAGQRVIRDFMPDQHRAFFAQLPFLLIGATDTIGRPWASLLQGATGFISSPSPTRLAISSLPPKGDPLADVIQPGRKLGTLGIEFSTRRRNRANGRIAVADSSGFNLNVEESFGNCHKYIVKRDMLPQAPPNSGIPKVEQLPALDDEAKQFIAAASTFFVASVGPGDALPDVSHRGGRPGFVELSGDSLIIPDYSGNLYFNTLGNLLLNPIAGLLFPNFESGDLLQLTGTTALVNSNPFNANTPGGVGFWRLKVTEARRQRNALKILFGSGEISPFSPPIAPHHA